MSTPADGLSGGQEKKSRPILFSGPMVRALLAGTKTQTRRIINPQPPEHIDSLHGHALRKRAPYAIEDYETGAPAGYGFESEDHQWRCPYGQPGDRLWVRETWGRQEGIKVHIGDRPNIQIDDHFERVTHRAGRENFAWGMYGPPKWKPSIHMPRTGCRLMLEILEVRVERVQDISVSDAIAEGIEYVGKLVPDRGGFQRGEIVDYSMLWESINGNGSWDANPWVWVVTFLKEPAKSEEGRE